MTSTFAAGSSLSSRLTSARARRSRGSATLAATLVLVAHRVSVGGLGAFAVRRRRSSAPRRVVGDRTGARRDPRDRPASRHVRDGRRRDARPRSRHARRNARDRLGRRTGARGRAAAGGRRRDVLPVVADAPHAAEREQPDLARRQAAATLARRLSLCRISRSTADLPIVFVADTAALERTDVQGKAVAMVDRPRSRRSRSTQFTIRGNFQATTAAMLRQHAARIAQAGGAAAILISDGSSALDEAFVATAAVSSRGTYAIDSTGGAAGTFARPATQNQNARRRPVQDELAEAARAGGRAAGRGNATTIPTLWVRNATLDVGADRRTPSSSANIVSETFYYPSGNVIGVVKGTDPRLAHEYVLYSGHQDHDGTRYVGERRFDLERRRRQRERQRGDAGHRARVRRASGAAPDSLRVARRGRARAPRLTLVRESFRPCRIRRSSPC